MATSADLTRLAVIEEVVYATIPTNPGWRVTRITGESISYQPNTVLSNEITPQRQVVDQVLAGGTSSGDINFELAYEPWVELLLTGAYCGAWGANVSDLNAMNMNEVIHSFSIEKRFTTAGGNIFHRFRGMMVNTFKLTVTPNQIITGSFSFIGTPPTVHTTLVGGATYIDPDNRPIMRAPDVTSINIDTVGSTDCFSGIEMTINNNVRAIECVGTLGPKEFVLGRAEIEATFSIMLNDNSFMTRLISQTDTQLSFRTTQPGVTGFPFAMYIWFMLRLKFRENKVVASGPNTDVINDITAVGLYDVGNATTVRVSRTAR